MSDQPIRSMDEFEAKKLLATYGVQVVGEFRCNTAEEAVEAATKLGYPVAAKGLGRSLRTRPSSGLCS